MIQNLVHVEVEYIYLILNREPAIIKINGQPAIIKIPIWHNINIMFSLLGHRLPPFEREAVGYKFHRGVSVG